MYFTIVTIIFVSPLPPPPHQFKLNFRVAATPLLHGQLFNH